MTFFPSCVLMQQCAVLMHSVGEFFRCEFSIPLIQHLLIVICDSNQLKGKVTEGNVNSLSVQDSFKENERNLSFILLNS